MKSTRRLFLKSGALALASVGVAPALGPSFLRSVVFADEPKRGDGGAYGRKILVCIFMRGAVDGLSMLVPHGDADYYKLRSTGAGGIALARTGDGSVLDLDGTFGLHPALAPLLPHFKSGHLAPIHAVGSHHPTRSHFDAQDFMETAMPGDKSAANGWLARTISQCPEDTALLKAKGSAIRTVSMTAQLPRSFEGDASALAINDLAAFGVGKSKTSRPRMAMNAPAGSSTGGFEALYAGAVGDVFSGAANGDVLHGAGKETFDALRLLENLDPNKYAPDNKADYGRGRLGNSLRQIAQLIKADVGLEIAFAEMGGYDTHVNQGAAQGSLARRLDELATAINGFYRDLGDRMGDVVILTMSEFGRTARQNANGGTDHGHGTAFFALGGPVKGGKVITKWPGLAPEQLYERRDLAITTDFRQIFGEVAVKHLEIRDLEAVFPNAQLKTESFRGVIRSS